MSTYGAKVAGNGQFVTSIIDTRKLLSLVPFDAPILSTYP